MARHILVLVIEDNRLADDRLAAVLEAQPDLKLVEEAEDAEDVIAFIRARANGFVLNDATVDHFLRTARSVATGTDGMPPSSGSALRSHLADDRRVSSTMDATRMTKREREITTLIAEGLSNKEIAERLNIATYTVKSHVHNILEKQALRSRLQIAARAHRSALNADPGRVALPPGVSRLATVGG
jgi:DNA-binding NarL/FixJ family response regulator